ncbi:hypothetical protein ACFQZ4_54670 [Catellatospora coxensis]
MCPHLKAAPSSPIPATTSAASSSAGRTALRQRDHHPKPEDVTARCFGNGDDLAVEISAPGWIIKTSHPSQVLTVENTDQGLSGDIDTTNGYLDSLRSVDWSQPDQLDIAATAAAPQDWNSPTAPAGLPVRAHRLHPVATPARTQNDEETSG